MMSATIIPFPTRPLANRMGKAPGKQPTSSTNKPMQASASSTAPHGRGGNKPTHASTTFHMELTIKLTWETTDAR